MPRVVQPAGCPAAHALSSKTEAPAASGAPPAPCRRPSAPRKQAAASPRPQRLSQSARVAQARARGGAASWRSGPSSESSPTPGGLNSPGMPVATIVPAPRKLIPTIKSFFVRPLIIIGLSFRLGRPAGAWRPPRPILSRTPRALAPGARSRSRRNSTNAPRRRRLGSPGSSLAVRCMGRQVDTSRRRCRMRPDRDLEDMLAL